MAAVAAGRNSPYLSKTFLRFAWNIAAFAILIAGLAVVVTGCGSQNGSSPYSAGAYRSQTSYRVKAGDTVYHIATRYGISVHRLMTANGLDDPRQLRVGQMLIIPASYSPGSYSSPIASYRTREASNAFPYRGVPESRQFAWPVAEGQVSSGFGMRNGAMHEGVDIAAPAGTPVHAADAGTVIFAGVLHGYGNTVIIEHDSHYATVYAHNERNLVREGERVARGETIGTIGRTGDATGSNLHFEVRRDNVAQNPLAYLPAPPAAPGITYAASGGE